MLDEAVNITGEASLADKKVQVYLAKSNAYLTNGDCLSAVQALVDGEQATGAATLSEREAYLRENIVVTNEKFYCGSIFENEKWYDVNGNLIKSSDATTGEYTEFVYDESGNQVKEISYGSDGSVWMYAEFEYDESGNEVKYIRYDADESVDWYEESAYDILGNRITVKSKDSEESRYSYEYTYIGE